MRVGTWLSRLRRELPGWWAWRANAGWYAAPSAPPPAPADRTYGWYLKLPNRIGPYPTPQLLRAACRERYGWNEHCATCGVLARDCGHRQPERDER